ncbi:MAG: rhodanese-like domain-containing protein, partial [Spirochaetales bacterium]|nr:rhodanese-like domain-containing protein [Spirochaetales bacterium]
ALITILLMMLLMTGLAAESKSSKAVLKTISSEDAYKMIRDNAKNKKFILIDIRTPEEFEGPHIKGAINIDYYSPDFKNQLKKLDRSKKYLIYCRSGNRTGKSLAIFKDLGFKEVYDLGGGIIAWAAGGFPIVQ